jgi:hypothetical protein
LKTLPVPELATSQQEKFVPTTESGYTLPNTLDGAFDVSDSSLYVIRYTYNNSNRLHSKRVRLTLPDYITEDEFANATSCVG